MPLSVDKRYQSTASMLTGYSLKINFNLSMENSPIDSEILNQSVVTSPTDLESSNWSLWKVSQKCSKYNLFDSKKGYENDKNYKWPNKLGRKIN